MVNRRRYWRRRRSIESVRVYYLVGFCVCVWVDSVAMAVAMSLSFGLLSSSVLLPEAHTLSFTRPSRSASASPLRMVRTVISCKVSQSDQGTRKIRGIMKPRDVTPEMAALVGAQQISRTQALKLIWAYIKANNLQVPIFPPFPNT